MKAFYSDTFVLPLPDGHKFPIEKYGRLRERLLREGIIDASRMHVPDPATDRELHRAHDPAYVARVVLGRLDPVEVRRIGFPWSEAMVERSRRSKMPEKKQSAWRFLWRSEDIRRKLLITLGILVIFRVAAVIPVPGVNTVALESFFQTNGAGFLGFLNLLSGGTIQNFSLMAMGVYPYITAQIILQLLVPIFPSLQKRMQEDQREGRKWMEKWTMYLTVPMAMLSAIGQINIFNSLSTTPIIPFGWSQSMWLQSVTTVLTMTAGTMFAIWLGELISEYG